MGARPNDSCHPPRVSLPSMHAIYLDNNATTPLLPAVWEAMRPYFAEVHGNPASAHQFGRHARRALEDARDKVAALLDAHPDEVIFTSGATEANNLALFGLSGEPPGHLIVSPVEHPCVVEPVRQLEQRGFAVDWLSVDGSGVARAEALPGLLRPDTRLVALMLANHETGALQPVAECASRIGDVLLHCDAAQAVGKVPVSFRGMGVASLSLSAHKFHGPAGIGALVCRRGVRLRPSLWGGHQQQGRRPGTEPVALVVGLATALEIASAERDSRRQRILELRSRFLDLVRSLASPIVVNGPADDGLPHVLNLSFPGLRADVLLMNLDLAGVASATGSACSSGSLLPSPVLQAMGVPDDVLHSAMRFSISHLLTVEEVEEAARRVGRVVRRLRELPAD